MAAGFQLFTEVAFSGLNVFSYSENMSIPPKFCTIIYELMKKDLVYIKIPQKLQKHKLVCHRK